MKVFISWSGTTSRAVAEALRSWLPKVLQGVEPFVSAKDIDKGSNWTVELARELEDAEFGVICLAPDNLFSPWLNYEAGAITKSVNSRVCPVLYGVSKEQVEAPMSQLQLTSIDKEDFTQLIGSMNKQSGSALSNESVEEAVDVWWPSLEKDLAAIAVPAAPVLDQKIPAPEPAKPVVGMEEMFSEILHRMREMDDRITKLSSFVEPPKVRPGPRGTKKSEMSPINELMMVSTGLGMKTSRASIGVEGLELFVDSELPKPIPSKLMTKAADVAQQMGTSVTIIGADRRVEFAANGYTDEPPF